MIRRRLMNHLQEADLRPEEGQALEERLERGELSAEDRERLAKVIRATQAAQQLLQDSASPPRATPRVKSSTSGSWPKRRGAGIAASPESVLTPGLECVKPIFPNGIAHRELIIAC